MHVNRLERLHAISETIRRSGHRPVSAARLADRFEVSTRTIERDLDSLRSAGAPLRSQAGRLGGTISLDSADGALVSLSVTQITALLIAVASAGSDMPYSNDAAAAADSLFASLPDNTKMVAASLRSRVRSLEMTPTVSPRIRRTIEEAVRRSVVVNITYIDANTQRTERSVEAIGFYHGVDGWHLNGWCELRDAGRVFRLDRITSATLTRRRNLPRDVDEVLGWVPGTTLTP